MHGFHSFKINEMREYFEKLMKPSVTNEKLEELLISFQDEILKSFENKLIDQNTKIEELGQNQT